MKKTLIIIAILLPLILLGAWGYLLINGAPQSITELGDMFSPQQTGDTSTPSFPEDVEGEPDVPAVIDTSASVVKLSPKPVAGGVMFLRDGVEYVRYAERGTGHIYEISLGSGATTRITNTTIPRATDAIWSKTGTRVAIASEIVLGQPEVLIGTIARNDTGGNHLDTFSLPRGSDNVLFAESGDAFFYTVQHAHGTTGYRYDLKISTTTEVFATPLRHITMLWDDTEDGEHYLYTDPAHDLMGYVYKVVDGSLAYVTLGAMGLTADRAGSSTLLIAHASENRVSADIYTIKNNSRQPVGIPVFPEKCAGHDVLVCAAPQILPAGTYPDDWYQGVVTLSDTLWYVRPTTGNSEAITHLESVTDQPIDVTSLAINGTDSKLLFMNKSDSTLWLANIQ